MAANNPPSRRPRKRRMARNPEGPPDPSFMLDFGEESSRVAPNPSPVVTAAQCLIAYHTLQPFPSEASIRTHGLQCIENAGSYSKLPSTVPDQRWLGAASILSSLHKPRANLYSPYYIPGFGSFDRIPKLEAFFFSTLQSPELALLALQSGDIKSPRKTRAVKPGGSGTDSAILAIPFRPQVKEPHMIQDDPPAITGPVVKRGPGRPRKIKRPSISPKPSNASQTPRARKRKHLELAEDTLQDTIPSRTVSKVPRTNRAEAQRSPSRVLSTIPRLVQPMSPILGPPALTFADKPRFSPSFDDPSLVEGRLIHYTPRAGSEPRMHSIITHSSLDRQKVPNPVFATESQMENVSDGWHLQTLSRNAHVSSLGEPSPMPLSPSPAVANYSTQAPISEAHFAQAPQNIRDPNLDSHLVYSRPSPFQTSSRPHTTHDFPSPRVPLSTENPAATGTPSSSIDSNNPSKQSFYAGSNPPPDSYPAMEDLESQLDQSFLAATPSTEFYSVFSSPRGRPTLATTATPRTPQILHTVKFVEDEESTTPAQAHT
ncbi:hypothetical protein BS47DRAFT_1338658 [Hydnum rufescens UP504]|uniref:Uncharacterized protein n=1 Tax=Hydnum rufescens UP504 TaxID=1448309 RepID=A0A9P6E0H2_9AGAM|nr:hypothetical protein BS47DRAFT_1338658 [Hydnum rufescens UP504]